MGEDGQSLLAHVGFGMIPIYNNIQHQCTSRSFFLTRICDRSRRSARCFGIPDLQGPGSQGSFTYGAFHAAGTRTKSPHPSPRETSIAGYATTKGVWVGGRKRSKTKLQVRYTHNRRFTLEFHSERVSPN